MEKNFIKSVSVIGICFMVFCLTSCQRTESPFIQDEELSAGWMMQSTALVGASGKEISDTGFVINDWYKAKVPGSVLGSLVADSVYKNIFFGRNLAYISDSSFNVPWWYRTVFPINHYDENNVYRLQFNGINYRADIWLNGIKIASSDTLEGGFRRFVLNVSKWIKTGKNVLAVKVIRPYPGDLTVGFVDWNPEPPDHNMGIWRTVRLMVSGHVSIDNPFVVSRVDTATLEHADLTISAFVHNYSDKTIHGVLQGMIGNNISFSKKVSLKPGENQQILFTPEQFPQLSVEHPKLWWVHTWGKPNLYNLHLQFMENHQMSDSINTRFGIRQISTYFTAEGHRGFRLNGKKILIKGGGWTDPMLLNADSAYEDAGIDYAVHLNLNALRMEGFWGHDQHLYDLCDEKGLLLMTGFSCQWEWTEYLGTPEDQFSAMMTPKQNDIAAESWRDQVLWLRNHPSIFLWLYGSDKRPRPSLEKRYMAALKELDTTRPAICSAADYTPGIDSATVHVSSLSGPSGVKMRGPYDYVPPVYWYIDTSNGGAFGFNTETSPGPEIPVLESLKKMIPADSLWPIGSSWLYHSARHNFYNLTNYNLALTNRLGKPKGLIDYLRKAQYLNYEGMRAMFEAFEVNRFKSTGIIQWMYNASWPKLWWQLYDYYLMPTGAFYGAKKANEPIHISYNYGKNAVDVINNTLKSENNLSAQIEVYDFNMKNILQKNMTVKNLEERKTVQLFSLPENLPISKVWFLSLKLYDENHQPISSNFYVLSTQKDLLDEKKTTWFMTPQSQFADLTMLQTLPDVKPEYHASFQEKGDTTFVTVNAINNSGHLAFMIHLDLRNKNTGESVLPVFWNDNYFTLLPGEKRIIAGYCFTRDLKGQIPFVTMDGWNIK